MAFSPARSPWSIYYIYSVVDQKTAYGMIDIFLTKVRKEPLEDLRKLRLNGSSYGFFYFLATTCLKTDFKICLHYVWGQMSDKDPSTTRVIVLNVDEGRPSERAVDTR